MNISYFSELDASEIDARTATVHDVAICTCGPARGHGLVVDRTTLEQMLESATEKGKVVTKLDHKSGISQVCGFLSGFYLDRNKLRGTWTLLKDQPQFAHTWSIIENMNDSCGLSASFTGEADGNKARCKEIISVDFVPHAATGDGGLFSRGDIADDESENNMKNQPKTTQELLEAILAGQDEIAARLDQVEAEHEHLLDALEALTGDEADEDDEDDADDDEPVLEEHGARGRGDFAAEYAKTVEFGERVRVLQLAGADPKNAFITAMQEFARSRYSLINM